MFGHLVAGPVVRYQSVAARLKSRVFDSKEFAEGLRRFMLGFAQKVLIGDTLAPLVDAGYALPAPSMCDTIVTVAAYTLHLYFDFAGYSSMAIGLGLMVGLKFPENFDNPYLSTSLADFCGAGISAGRAGCASICTSLMAATGPAGSGPTSI
jgi:alginate O-acetyltransferase complex protein AlgI